jgi:UDP-N-acetylmuramoyl-tripeptide--D-alanyl-D-alanine ligase
MIPLALAEIASIVGGELIGESVIVDGPVVIDSREEAAGGLFVAFAGEHVDGHDFSDKAAANGAVACLGSRPTSLPTVVVADVQAALQALASTVVGRLRDGGLTVVAVTGSQGKTSTKDLMAAVFAATAPTVATKGSFNNEIGMPLTALRADASTRFLLLEMGARGIGHIKQLTDLIRPDISVVLNVGHAHIGEFGSRDAIAQAKGELVEALTASGTAVLNADDERVAAMASRTDGSVLTFAAREDADVRIEDLVLDDLGRPQFTLVGADLRIPVEMRLIGAHQAINAAAAAAAALVAGIPLESTAAALEAVASLSKWRMELHELPNGVVLINDAYNANPDSMHAAIDALASIGRADRIKRTIAVLGEMRELGATAYDAHREVGAYAADAGIDELVVVADAARGISDGAPGQAVEVADNDAALAWLRDNLREGDAVLFKASNGARLYEVAEALQ